jgi:DNA-binding beta-propeller fold protein YncE
MAAIVAASALAGLQILEGARIPSGYPQLMSTQSLARMDGVLCALPTGRAETPLVAALMEVQSAASSERRTVNADREPLRIIQDEYPTFSAAVADPIRNEIVANDQSLFQIMVFDRMSHTPPTARFTEPQRVISGPDTTLEFECGIYVDPKTGEIYTLNNDIGDRLAVFAPGAKGNARPTRYLHTPHAIYGIAVDEQRQEMYITAYGGAVVVFDKMADGEKEPKRSLRGDRTMMGRSTGIAIDTRRRLLFVANQATTVPDADPASIPPPSITVYPQDANGEVAPVRTIMGSRTQLNLPSMIALDERRDELFVANDGGNSILVFRSTDQGDVAPVRAIKGPRTALVNPNSVYLDTTNQEIVVTNLGNHSIAVFAADAAGDVPPKRLIRSAPAGKTALKIANPGAAGYDSKRDEILVPN